MDNDMTRLDRAWTTVANTVGSVLRTSKELDRMLADAVRGDVSDETRNAVLLRVKELNDAFRANDLRPVVAAVNEVGEIVARLVAEEPAGAEEPEEAADGAAPAE